MSGVATTGQSERVRVASTPRDWPVVVLGDVCDVQLGKMLSPKSKVGIRPVPYLRNENVQWNRVDLSDVAWMDFSEREEAKFRLKPGDLLVCEGGEPGRAAVWRGEIERCCFQKALHRIRPRANRVHPPFLMYRLWQSALDKEFADAQSQTTIAHLPREKLLRLTLPLPPLTCQERIASWLTQGMEAASAARRAALDCLTAAEALPAAIYRQAFGDAHPFDASPLSPIAPTRPGWSWHRLTDLARLATGHTPSRRCPEYWEGDIPWLQLPDIRALDGRAAQDTSEHTNELGISNSAAVLLPPGTVCLSRTASVGFVTVLAREMATSQDFVNWICGPDLDPQFLMHLFIASRKSIRELGSGAVHNTIYFPTVKQFAVCAPSVIEQRSIATTLSENLAAADSVIRRCREVLAAIDSIPAALLREAFCESQHRGE